MQGFCSAVLSILCIDLVCLSLRLRSGFARAFLVQFCTIVMFLEKSGVCTCLIKN